MSIPIVFFTDPHLGLNRIANTTPASRALLREKISEKVASVISGPGYKVCVGDLFDTFSNNEAALLDGLNVADRCEIVLAGNHDVTNRKDVVGSLQLIDSISNRVDITPFGDSGIEHHQLEGTEIVTVPHVATQELFTKSLVQAAKKGQQAMPGGIKHRVLLLHANYESPFAEAETTLNLTEEGAEGLLKYYDYIIMGHEHQPRDLFGGRLIILGNTHPTGFNDISDKRVAWFQDGKMEFHTVWDAGDGYAVFSVNDVPESTEAQFVRIGGDIEAGDAGKLSKAIAGLWKNSPNLLAVKSDVNIKMAEADKGEQAEVEDLPTSIRRDLEGSPMQEMFVELLERVG